MNRITRINLYWLGCMYFSIHAVAQEIYTSRFELPSIKDKEIIIRHKGYTTSFNTSTCNPNWVAWMLTKSRTEGNNKRSSKFYTDKSAPEEFQVTQADYSGSGYDRGHQCPAADNAWDSEAMRESFYMTNMCPQTPSLNRGDWKELEDQCRTWVQTLADTLYIVCGPIYTSENMSFIGKKHQVAIPDAFFKAIVKSGPTIQGIGFIYPNTTQNLPMEQYCVSIDSIEKVTGYDLFPALPDKTEKKVEKNKSLKRFTKQSDK